jgi:phosphoribosylaminoimidazole-succinocarboxamide synthase
VVLVKKLDRKINLEVVSRRIAAGSIVRWGNITEGTKFDRDDRKILHYRGILSISQRTQEMVAGADRVNIAAVRTLNGADTRLCRCSICLCSVLAAGH